MMRWSRSREGRSFNRQELKEAGVVLAAVNFIEVVNLRGAAPGWWVAVYSREGIPVWNTYSPSLDGSPWRWKTVEEAKAAAVAYIKKYRSKKAGD